MFNAFNHPTCHQMSRVLFSDCWLTVKPLLYFLREFGHKFEAIDMFLANKDRNEDEELLLFPYPICKDENLEEENLLKLPRVRRFSFLSTPYMFNWYSIGYLFPNLVELSVLGIFFPLKEPIPYVINSRLPLLRKLIFSVPQDWFYPWDSQFWVFMDLKLNLVELALIDISVATNLHFLRTFLESQKNTLKILSICSAIKPSHPFFNEVSFKSFDFAELPNLIELTVDDVFFRNMNTLNSIPNVEILHCSFLTYEKWKEIFQKDMTIQQQFLPLKKIDISFIEPKYLLKLANFFPNLENLSSYSCTDKLFAILCKEFTGLKTIRIKGGMTQLGLLGLSKGDAKNLDRNEIVKKVLRGPSIASFKGLENLYIVAAEGSKIPENVVQLSLYVLPKLKRFISFGVHISAKGRKRFTDAGFKPYEMAKVLPLHSESTCAFGFVKYDSPLSVGDETHDIYKEVATMFRFKNQAKKD